MAYVVVVTGASGYIASELTTQLLEKGYTVRGTVRSLKNAEKVEHLKKLGDCLPGKLELYEADLLKEGSFDKVMEGADYVYHTASPYQPKAEDVQKELVEPALEGTRTVLNSVAKYKKTIKRVVLTSSVVAICSVRQMSSEIGKNGVHPKNGKAWSDADWNEDSKPDVQGEGYPYSKVVAEKEAWKLAEKHGFEMATIHPCYVYGPILSHRTDATSVKIIQAFVEGKAEIPPGALCDVRDVAKAHILAAELPHAAGGRFIVSEDQSIDFPAIMKGLHARFPSWKLKDPEKLFPAHPMFDNSKTVKELGLQITPGLTTLVDNIVTMVQLGLAKPIAK